MKQRKIFNPNKSQNKIFLAEESPFYFIDDFLSTRFEDYVRGMLIAATVNEYGDLTISGKRIC